MTDYSHLDALNARLHREKQRLAAARTENERAFRHHEITMCEREITSEYAFLGITPVTLDEILNDDDLLRELGT